MSTLYSPGDPAVLRPIERVVGAADKYKIALNVCDKMDGDPFYTILLLGMGIRQLSVTPHSIPAIKRVIAP